MNTWLRRRSIADVRLDGAGIALVSLLIFFGTVGKSAQFPLHVWLPDAMEGPTPVSAMIHAATMVSAGVFLLVRMFPMFFVAGEVSPGVMQFIAFTGAFTALFASTIAVAQWDIKRVLAYSTISQLGYMVAAIGIGAYTAALFHLITHAFFKALLFLGSSSVIHGMEHGFHHAHEHGRVMPMPRSRNGATAILTLKIRRICATWAGYCTVCRAPGGHSSSVVWPERPAVLDCRLLVQG